MEGNATKDHIGNLPTVLCLNGFQMKIGTLTRRYCHLDKNDPVSVSRFRIDAQKLFEDMERSNGVCNHFDITALKSLFGDVISDDEWASVNTTPTPIYTEEPGHTGKRIHINTSETTFFEGQNPFTKMITHFTVTAQPKPKVS